PHRGWSAEGRDTTARDFAQRLVGLEPSIVVHKNGRARIPGSKETTPGMLGPSRRTDVEMQVSGADPDPVHGGEMTYRIALVSVQHQLGQSRGARGEIQEKRVRGPGDCVRQEFGRFMVSVTVGNPIRG